MEIGDRPAEPPLCPAWLPEDPASGRASIPRTVYQPGKSSVRDLQSPSAHHSSVVFRHRNQSVTTPMIALDFSGTTTQSASHNVALNQNSKGTAQVTEANQLPPATAITAAEHPNLNLLGKLINQFMFNSNLDISYSVEPNSGSTSKQIVEKCYSRNLITVTRFCSQQNQSQQSVVVFSKEHQNDTVPTNSNDVAKLHQLTTDISCEATKSCWSPSRNAFLTTILSRLVPDATLKTQRFNLSKRRRTTYVILSVDRYLATGPQTIDWSLLLTQLLPADNNASRLHESLCLADQCFFGIPHA
ncbi:hypothetical protein F511_35919 [Dorcoceras hygrometricum]|uniref:Uncharacterized protein n=1 Tax=Dorcoceras hygrometricum TaxID=472368 RepID=A0A2Z7BIF9_9LAMI|nr:hypothetical protein F511_35919 [Dorcoceras hygrometricum]